MQILPLNIFRYCQILNIFDIAYLYVEKIIFEIEYWGLAFGFQVDVFYFSISMEVI